MNRTLVALWVIIASSILAVVALAAVWNHGQESSARLEFAALLQRQLEPYNRDIAAVFESYDRTLQRALEDFDPSSRSAIVALEREPLVGLLVVVGDDGAKGQLIYPALESTVMADRSLVTDALLWLRDSNFTQRGRISNSYSVGPPIDNSAERTPVNNPPSQLSAPTQSSFQAAMPEPTATVTQSAAQSQTAGGQTITTNAVPTVLSHWTTWYHGRGLVLGYWTAGLQNTIAMVIVPRGRWLADVVAALPDNAGARDDALVQLLDVEGNVLTQWGNLALAASPADDLATGDAEMAVTEPLEGWRLRMTLSPAARSMAMRTGARWASATGALGFSVAFLLLGALITLNLKRQLRLAQQQVSFVNQVSHELRTPLTNIRMYTDLALDGLQKQHEVELGDEVQRLKVIQQESDRLGRLIDNVLSFARLGRSQPELRLQRVPDVEAMIDATLETFSPQLSELDVHVQRERGVHGAVQIDREIFEQILINLVSNALKYASAGKLLRIETRRSNEQLIVRVIDHGPGIAKRMRHRIFEPFVRLSNRLEDPAGTGIGLSIARQLARQHGGECTLETTTIGSCFTFTLRTKA